MSVVEIADGARPPIVHRFVASAPPICCLGVGVSGVNFHTMAGAPGPTKHRANYIFERGTWRATCRECGWHTADPARRQAALLFRAHIRQVAEDEAAGRREEHDDGG